ncbi:MAG: RHS repeat-associated core domain-containing protein, partial [Rhodocyclaceae bacterium]|nr:RHS repeat-associated core domain-containing protein [Rhodocyclaceae bacterium]
YTLRSILGVSPLAHTVAITPGITDLSGKSSLLPLTVDFAAGAADRLAYRRADPTEIPTSSAANLYGFHGHEIDPATGLVYMRNRWYDPAMGRFVTADPLGYVDGPSMYQIARNSPVNFIDPMGELTIFINGINNQAYPGLDPEERTFFDSLEDPADHEFNEPIYGPSFKATWPARIQGGIEAGLTWLRLRGREVREVWTALEKRGDLERLNPREPVILIGHSGGRPVAQRVAKKIRNYLRDQGLQDHPIWVIGYNGAFDRQRPPDGVDGIRVVSDDDVLGLLRLWKPGDMTVPGGHGPDLGEGVSTVFNTMIWLIHFDAEHPGAISAALGSGPKRSSRAIIDYMKQRMSTMAPGDSAALIEAMSSELSIVVGQP